MYYSLESRSPFLDHRLLELSAQLPLSVWMLDETPKGLLKRLAAKRNPHDVVYSAKRGFSIPIESYFLGNWGTLLLELTNDGVAAQLGLLDPIGIRKYLSHHGLRPQHRLERQLFSILCLEIWLRVFHTRTQTPAELGRRLAATLQ